MKKILLIIIGVLLLQTTMAQVGINTEEPEAILDIKPLSQSDPEKNVGLIVPCIESFPATTPSAEQHSMIAFQSNADPAGYEDNSFYFWNNAQSIWDRFLDEYTIELDLNKIIVSGSSLRNSSNGNVANLQNANTPRVIYFDKIEAVDEENYKIVDNKLEIGKSGQYVLIMTAGLLKGGDDGIMTYTAEVLINDVVSTSLSSTVTIAFRTGRSGIFSLNSLVDLMEGDKISIRMRQEYNIQGSTITAQLNTPATIYLQRVKDY